MEIKQKAKQIVKKIWEEFGQICIPDRITEEMPCRDQEREQIEAQFSGIRRTDLTENDVSMMLIDSALILPEAFLYFLPRVVNDVLLSNADIYFLTPQIDILMNINWLTYKQKCALKQLKALLTYVEEHYDEYYFNGL
ncbi:hypothetical protein SAMN02745216_04764 [Desulfatibacillum alkenivorans DSM 16219]|uniref:Uncharacterized protein n=1 Tax=Desulfatibacillum alkenivorans DSM 16219 TaxID=1121393 RepID=A0A1M6YI94_9BACT|nr:hypothetical protein [Desulfatibacillum alkenivorans]SHL17853.1 hypothetical protein SAMN02745216_04764 [Desulfatibacillum alkenivorans DSM 16219]